MLLLQQKKNLALVFQPKGPEISSNIWLNLIHAHLKWTEGTSIADVQSRSNNYRPLNLRNFNNIYLRDYE